MNRAEDYTQPSTYVHPQYFLLGSHAHKVPHSLVAFRPSLDGTGAAMDAASWPEPRVGDDLDLMDGDSGWLR